MDELQLPVGQIISGKLTFKSKNEFLAALKLGVFYLRHNLGSLLQEGEDFAGNFYKPKENLYTGYAELEYEDSILGYEDRPEQVEQIQLERNLWNKYFPESINDVLNYMYNLSDIVALNVLRELNISSENIEIVLGREGGKQSLEYCIFNHFRGSKKDIGFTTHTDSGFITLIHSNKSGLEGEFSSKWKDINIHKGCFTAIFGDSFEILTKNLQTPVKALLHRVKSTTKNSSENLSERFSFGTYIGPRFDMNMYCCNKNKEPIFHQKFIEFSKVKAKKMGYEFHSKVA